ncbi:sensor histidine kinase [Spirilliplanes yamanashiensis]|nr:histidine kinase [Spirilliplanes yamanashiensis]MDP9817681.1 signal transduction histidine kinase [Spirilliplanes yamanashiensis]
MTRRDAAVPLAACAVLTLLGVAELLLDREYRDDPAPVAAAVLVVAVATGMAAWWPLAAASLINLAFPVSALLGGGGPPGAAVIAILATYGWLGYRRAPDRAWWAAPVAGQLLALTAVLLSDLSLWESLFFTTLYWAALWVGRLVRRERERAEQLVELAAALDAEREARAHAAVVAERQRISREIHDAVAHSVSVMVLQVGVVRTRLTDRPVEADVLHGVERLGRQSVEELRALVGILRDEASAGPPAPPPSLARVDELLDAVRAAGLPVQLEVEGTPADLPRTVDVSAYRVTQEALSNVLRHAGPAPTTVRLRHTGDALTVEVVDAGPQPGATPPPPGGPGGNGLAGMRERVALFAGSLDAGPVPGGGFAVRARFPLGRAR